MNGCDIPRQALEGHRDFECKLEGERCDDDAVANGRYLEEQISSAPESCDSSAKHLMYPHIIPCAKLSRVENLKRWRRMEKEGLRILKPFTEGLWAFII